MMTPRLRITASRAPYRRAGLTFEASAGKTIGVVIVAVDELAGPQAFEELFADPHLDVLLSGADGGWYEPMPVSAGWAAALRAQANDLEFAEMCATLAPSPAKIVLVEPTTDVLVESDAALAARLELEAGRPDDDLATGEADAPPAPEPVAADQPAAATAPAKPLTLPTQPRAMPAKRRRTKTE